MIAGFAGGDRISERLQESLARLRKDIDRVELWAGALEGFSQPIPEYDAARRYRLAPEKGDSPEIGKVKSPGESCALGRPE
jgi:hypothetical protein